MVREEQPWLSISSPPPDVHIRLNGVTFHLNKQCMASRSAKLAKLFETTTSHHVDLSSSCDAKAFELVVRFCYAGRDPGFSADNVIPLACTASFLEMTEDHSPCNLLKLSISFLAAHVLPRWNATLAAFRAAAPVLDYAQRLGLADACLKSIQDKALANPQLIEEEDTKVKEAGARRKLFCSLPEDITSLPAPLFELAISALTNCGINPEHVACCVFRYARRWIHRGEDDGTLSIYEKMNQREVMEAVERLLPNRRGVLSVARLAELLRAAIVLHANQQCRTGLEARMGRQLPEASIEDLLMPNNGYAHETMYDIEFVERILNHFFASHQGPPEVRLVVQVTELVEDFMAFITKDRNLDKSKFVHVLEVLAAVMEPIVRCHDGLYRVVDAYLASHGELTAREREDVCSVLNCRRMSAEACEHAARNERLSLRMIAQVLFIGQLRIRAAIMDIAGRTDGNGGEGEEKRVVETFDYGVNVAKEEEELRMDGGGPGEMEKKESAGVESEMKEGCSNRNVFLVKKKDGWRVLREMKNILGCKSDLHECDCLKKKLRP